MILLIVTIVLASTLSMSAPVEDHKMVVTGVTDLQFVHCRTREENMVSWEDAPLEQCTQERSCKTGRAGTEGLEGLDFRFDLCLDEENKVIWRMSCKKCWNNNTIYMYKDPITAKELKHGKMEEIKMEMEEIMAKLFFCIMSIVFNAESLFNVAIVLYDLFI